MKAGFCLLPPLNISLEQQLPFEPIELCFPVPLRIVVRYCHSLSQHTQSFFGLSCSPVGLGQYRQTLMPSEFWPVDSVSIQTLTYPLHALLDGPLLDKHPTQPCHRCPP